MIDYQRLKDIREDHDINQESMANNIGVKRSTYSLWELGINIIPLPFLCKFADYFNLSLDYVLGLTNSRGNKNLIKDLDLNVLGNNLKELRKKKNLSQIEMAKILNVSQTCIAKYEKGKNYISTSNLYLYSKVFKVSMTELCGKVEKKN